MVSDTFVHMAVVFCSLEGKRSCRSKVILGFYGQVIPQDIVEIYSLYCRISLDSLAPHDLRFLAFFVDSEGREGKGQKHRAENVAYQKGKGERQGKRKGKGILCVESENIRYHLFFNTPWGRTKQSVFPSCGLAF